MSEYIVEEYSPRHLLPVIRPLCLLSALVDRASQQDNNIRSKNALVFEIHVIAETLLPVALHLVSPRLPKEPDAALPQNLIPKRFRTVKWRFSSNLETRSVESGVIPQR